jgi:hypothetical protein
MSTLAVETSLKWNVFVAARQGLTPVRVDCGSRHNRGTETTRGDRRAQESREGRRPQNHRKDAAVHP